MRVIWIGFNGCVQAHTRATGAAGPELTEMIERGSSTVCWINAMTQMTLCEVPAPATVCYFATDGLNIKIGHSCDARRRGGELRATMLLTIGGGEVEERRQHAKWRHLRIGNSEWFRPGNRLLLWLIMELAKDTPNARELRIIGEIITARDQAEGRPYAA